MNLTPILIAVIIGSSVIIGLSGFYEDMTVVYQPSGNITNTTDFTQFNQSFNRVDAIMADISNKTVDISASGLVSLGGIQDAAIIFFDVIKLIAEAPVVIANFVSSGLMKIPGIGGAAGAPWFTSMLTVIITITIVGLIVSIVFKRGESEI